MKKKRSYRCVLCGNAYYKRPSLRWHYLNNLCDQCLDMREETTEGQFLPGLSRHGAEAAQGVAR